MMKLRDIFKAARVADRAEYKAKEAEKIGNLRAGSSGIVSEAGEIAGACHRKSHLRQLGMEIDPPTEDKLIMFDLGYASEDIIHKKIMTSLPEGHVVLREEEIPIEWTTSNDTKVTGRPDMVICLRGAISGDADNPWDTLLVNGPTPILGIELKSTHSVWVARDVVFGRTPKMSNLIQAAHYMWKLDIPYKLIYTNYSQLGQGMAGNEWIIKQFPAYGEPGSEFIEYSSRVSRKTGKEVHTIKHIKQFEVIYDLRFDSKGRLEYKLEEEADSEWTRTLITHQSIEKYFEQVSQMASNKDLGPRPSTINPMGKPAGYTDCDYCPLQDTCDSYEEKGYSEWLKAVYEAVNPGEKK